MAERRYLNNLINEQRLVLGARATTNEPAVVELYGSIGLDFVWLDLEHTGASPTDSQVVERIARAADASGIDPLVRLPTSNPAVVRKVLGTGIRSILIPRVDSPSEIRRAIEASRFVYDGKPGAYGASAGRGSMWGTQASVQVDEHDETVSVGCMIETQAAVENIEEILAVPELDFVFIGPSDLSVSLGHPLERNHLDVQRTVERAKDACLDADIPVGYVTDDTADAESAIEQGYRLLRIGDELGSARSVLRSRFNALRPEQR